MDGRVGTRTPFGGATKTVGDTGQAKCSLFSSNTPVETYFDTVETLFHILESVKPFAQNLTARYGGLSLYLLAPFEENV